MIMTLFQTLFLGLDSAVCCLAMGAVTPTAGMRPGLALSFGLCDLAASLIASFFASLSLLYVVPALPLSLYAVLAMSIGVGARTYPRLAWAAPLVLSLDNLATAGSVPDAFASGVSSALFALLALQVGAWWGRAREMAPKDCALAAHE